MRGASEHRAMIGSADQFTDHNALFLTQRNGPVVLSHRAAARRAAQTPGNVGQTSVFARCSLVLMSVRWRSRDSAAGFETRRGPTYKLSGLAPPTATSGSSHARCPDEWASASMSAEEPSGCRRAGVREIPGRELDAPRGFEPRLTESESVVLPLDDRASPEGGRDRKRRPDCQRSWRHLPAPLALNHQSRLNGNQVSRLAFGR